ncbi:hypothetical protein ACJMK2_007488, partial [Sinanodonta woodiana]
MAEYTHGRKDSNMNQHILKRRLVRRTLLEKILLFLVVILVLTVGCLAGVLVSISNKEEIVKVQSNCKFANSEGITPANESKPDYCGEKDGQNKSHSPYMAADIVESIDPKVDPCEDFYEYACGAWKRKHVIPQDMSNLYAYGVLRENVLTKVKVILEEEVNANDLKAQKNAKYLYQSCVNETLLEERGHKVANPLLKELGGWPILGNATGHTWNESEFDLNTLLTTTAKYYNLPIIVPWVGLDDLDNTKYIIFIDQTWFGMDDAKQYLEKMYEDQLSVYKRMIINTALIFGANPETAIADATEILRFETDLANITIPPEERRDNNKLYNRMTIKDLLNNFTVRNASAAIQFNWLEYLQRIVDLGDNNVTLHENEYVVLMTPGYYTQLFNLLNKYSKRTIANYVVWRVMMNRLNNLPKRFTQEYFKYYQVAYGNEMEAARWKRCTRYVMDTFGMLIGRLFVKEHFDNHSKNEVKEMIENIRSTFIDNVDKLDWMDNQTKMVAKEKAKAIIDLIGYPDYIMEDETLESMYANITMDPKKYFENVLYILNREYANEVAKLRDTFNVSIDKWTTPPTIVNAFYSPQKNQIIFPAGILQPPYFRSDQPKALNYGGIGFLMAHEIIHGFDDSGRKYDLNGNLQNWWTRESEQKFKEKAQCLIDQYSSYVSPISGINVNGVRTQGENIADNGGVVQAYLGYHGWLKSQSHPEPTLPGLNFTSDQLFFINIARIRCGSSRKADDINHILTGAHSPNNF